MTTVYTPAPTYADPVVVDEKTGKNQFNPIWLKWFLDLTAFVSSSGSGSTVDHNSLSGLQGGGTAERYHLTFADYTRLTTPLRYIGVYDTTNQTAAAATRTAVTFNTTRASSGISVGTPTSRIVFSAAGLYNISFSAQCANTGAAVDNITWWLAKNGTDITDSAGISGVPAKHGTINGALTFSWSGFLQVAAGDYIEYYWTTDAGTSFLATYPAGVGPTHPESPCVDVVINQIA